MLALVSYDFPFHLSILSEIYWPNLRVADLEKALGALMHYL